MHEHRISDILSRSLINE